MRELISTPSRALHSLTLAAVLLMTACSVEPILPTTTESAPVKVVSPVAFLAASEGLNGSEPDQIHTTASPIDENPTQLQPTLTLAFTPTPKPSDTPTQVPSDTSTPDQVEGVTKAETEIYAGPADNYPWLATYSIGITLTVLGKNESMTWLAVEIPPEQIGWISESDLRLIEPLEELVLVPTPEALPTIAPLIGSTIQLSVIKQLVRAAYGLSSYIRVIAVIQTTQPTTTFTLEMISSKGKVVFREKNMTDRTGKISIWLPRQDKDIYTVVVTTELGDHAEASLEINSLNK